MTYVPPVKQKQRALAEDYYMCLLELRVIYENHKDLIGSREEDKIRAKMTQITSDPDWRPEKWNFYKAVYG